MKIQYAITVASLLGLVSVSAAPISWAAAPYGVNGVLGTQLNTGVFDKSGTLHLAENSGGTATTFDGISFGAGTTTFDGGAIGTFHEIGVSPNLSHFGTYGNEGTASRVSIAGLTIGNTYRIQALVYDGRNTATIQGRTVSFDGVDQGQYANSVDNVTWGAGLLVTGTFIADATTQDFTIETFHGATSKGGQLNALLVHNTAVAAVPSSPALLSIGGLSLSLHLRE